MREVSLLSDNYAWSSHVPQLCTKKIEWPSLFMITNMQIELSIHALVEQHELGSVSLLSQFTVLQGCVFDQLFIVYCI